MGKSIDFAGIADLFHAAHTEGRNFLFEYEVYTLLACAWAETPPRTVLLPRGGRPSDEELTALPGDRVVLKIVSPSIVHKTEVGGVRIVPKTPDKIRSALRRMLYEVPESSVRSSVPTWAAWILSVGMSPPPCPPCCATSQPVATSPSQAWWTAASCSSLIAKLL